MQQRAIQLNSKTKLKGYSVRGGYLPSIDGIRYLLMKRTAACSKRFPARSGSVSSFSFFRLPHAANTLLLVLAFLLPMTAFGCKKPEENEPVCEVISNKGGATTPASKPSASPEAAPSSPPKTEPPKKGRIYLTFDDGPVRATNGILDILNSYGIKATFFTVGQFIEYNPAIALRIVEEGHALACHTYSHNFDKIYSSPEAFLADVERWQSVAEKAIKRKIERFAVRFPGGSNNPVIGGSEKRGAYLDLLHQHGCLAFDWNIANNDKWLAGNTENLPVNEYLMQSYRKTLDMYENKNLPLIMLMHDTSEESVALLRTIIDDLIMRGYSFGTLDELDTDYLF